VGERWAFHVPTRVVFGDGALHDVGDVTSGRVLLVASPGTTTRGITARMVEQVGTDRVVVHDRVDSAPDVRSLDRWIELLRGGESFDTVVAVGGGSAIDTGKVLSLALAAGGTRIDELLHAPAAYQDTQPLRLVAIPTTAGTGSEVTPFATVWDTTEGRKHSIGSPKLFPAVALVDPELSASLPWEQTLGPGLDAFVQCFEAVWNRNATPPATALAERGISLVPDALRQLSAEPNATDARTHMAEAALLSGLAIGQTRTALAHSMSYPLTARLGLPHGLACALVLPAVLEFNLEQDDGRLASVAGRLGLEDADALLPYMAALYEELGVAQAVARYVPELEALETLVPEMRAADRADNNVRPVSNDDIRTMVRRTTALFGTRTLR
jgi:alcohol dehydrogenase